MVADIQASNQALITWVYRNRHIIAGYETPTTGEIACVASASCTCAGHIVSQPGKRVSRNEMTAPASNPDRSKGAPV